MSFIALKCPHCAGDIQFDIDRQIGFCNYCGSKIIRDDVLTANININNDTAVKSSIELAKEALFKGNIAKSREYIEKARLLDNSVSDVYYIMAICSRANPEKEKEFVDQAGACSRSFNIFSFNDYKAFKLVRVNFVIPNRTSPPMILETTVKIDGIEVAAVKGGNTTIPLLVTPENHTIRVDCNCMLLGGLSNIFSIIDDFDAGEVNSLRISTGTGDLTLVKGGKDNNLDIQIMLKLPNKTLETGGNFVRYELSFKGKLVIKAKKGDYLTIWLRPGKQDFTITQVDKKGLRSSTVCQTLTADMIEGNQYEIVLEGQKFAIKAKDF